MKKTQKSDLWRVLKFVLFSASAGVIQIVTFTLMNEIGGLPYWPSYLTALVLSVLFNFTVNRKFTFKAANNVPLAMLLVAAYYAVFTPLSTLWGDALTKIGWNEYLVLAITMAINLSTEFLYQRFVVYRNSVDTNAEGQRDSFRTVGEYELDENGNLLTWDVNTVGYFVTELVKSLEPVSETATETADSEEKADATANEEKAEKDKTERKSEYPKVSYLGGGSYGKAYLVETERGKRVMKAVKIADIARSEVETLRLLRNAAGEYIPEVYAVHTVAETNPVTVIEEEYMEGKNLVNPRFMLFGKQKRIALARKISEVLAKVREITSDKFGKICGEKFDSWQEYYKKYAENVLSRADKGVEEGLVKKEPVELAKKAFERFDEIFSEPVGKACLVHGDVNIANVTVDPKTLELKAIIDPYGSVFGDPEYELFQLRNMGGDRYFLYETVKNSFVTSKNCDAKCAFYALVNEIDCALLSGTSKGVFFDYMFRTQMKRLETCLADLFFFSNEEKKNQKKSL